MSGADLSWSGAQYVSALYDAALESGDFASALPPLVAGSNSVEAALVFVEGKDTHGERRVEQITTQRAITPEIEAAYQDHFQSIDPKAPIFERRRPGFVFNDIRYFTDAFVRRDPFYQEYSRPLGCRHTIDILISRADGRDCYLALMRSARSGPYDAQMETFLRTAARHASRALSLKERMDDVQSALDRANAVLDSLHFGIVVFDERSRVSFVNAAARAACSRGMGFQIGRGRLLVQDSFAEQSLNAAIARIADGRDRNPLVIRPFDERGNWILAVLPLPQKRPGFGITRGAILMIIDTAAERSLRVEDLRNLYGLTCAEAELAAALGRGETLGSIAERRSVKHSTVRSQLLAVLAKMNLHRQADLTRVLAAVPRTAE